MTPCRLRAVLLAGATVFLVPFAAPPTELQAQEGTRIQDRAQDLAQAEAPAVPTDFTEIVARMSPSVVAIATRQLVEPEELPPDLPEGLRERFGEQNGEMPPRESQGVGSGFLISAAGHIVTNSHVIQQATDIQVQLDDGTSLPAELVGSDPPTDLAVLKVDLPATMIDDMVVAEWGDSDALEPGAWTIAVGSPFGLGDTVTVGVLSARSRDIRAGPYDDFLQTDAAINLGNSGGPLFNAAGEVVGVNTAIFSPTGASVGIGFAVPSRTAARVVGELIETGEVSRGFLGVRLQDVTEVLARAFGAEAARGALVGNVEEDSPADAAGISRGDIILALEDADIRTARDLSFAAAERRPGEIVTLTILRDGETMERELEVGRRPMPEPEPVAEVEPPDDTRLGLSLLPVPDAMRDELAIDEPGALIDAVEPGGLGAASGLRRGDVIVEADARAVEDPSDIVDAWAEAREEDRPLLLRILRGPASVYVAIES